MHDVWKKQTNMRTKQTFLLRQMCILCYGNSTKEGIIKLGKYNFDLDIAESSKDFDENLLFEKNRVTILRTEKGIQVIWFDEKDMGHHKDIDLK